MGDSRLKQFSTNARAKFCNTTRASSLKLSSRPSSSTFFPFGALCFFARAMSSDAPESFVSAVCRCSTYERDDGPASASTSG